jgi:hypothetical protein
VLGFRRRGFCRPAALSKAMEEISALEARNAEIEDALAKLWHICKRLT